jgi:hypothetical protein
VLVEEGQVAGPGLRSGPPDAVGSTSALSTLTYIRADADGLHNVFSLEHRTVVRTSFSTIFTLVYQDRHGSAHPLIPQSQPVHRSAGLG